MSSIKNRKLRKVRNSMTGAGKLSFTPSEGQEDKNPRISSPEPRLSILEKQGVQTMESLRLLKKLRSEESLREVPLINASSRQMAEQKFEKSFRPMTYINTPSDKSTELRTHLLIKNSLKNMKEDLPMNMKVSLQPNHLSAYVSPKHKTTSGSQNSEWASLKELKDKMDSRPPSNCPDTNYRDIKDIYSRSIKWKEIIERKNAKQSMEKDEEEMSECTFHPTFRSNTNNSRVTDDLDTVNTQEPSVASNKRYTPIAPTPAHISYSSGINMEGFENRAKKLFDYKAFIN